MLRRVVNPPCRVLITLDAVGGVWRYALDVARGLEPHGIIRPVRLSGTEK